MRITLLFIVLLFVALQLRAQESQPRLFLGIAGGYNSNNHAGDFMGPTPHGELLPYTTGNGNGIILGFAGDYWFTANGSTAIQCKLYYEQKPGNFTSEAPSFVYFDTNTNSFSLSPVSTYQATYNLINFEALFKYNVIDRIGISIGPKLGYAITKTYKESGLTYYTTSADTSRNPTFYPDTLNSSGNIQNAYSLRFGVTLSLQYDILFGDFLITPALSFDLGLTPVTQQGWYISTLAGTIDVKYGL
ncbi:MAG TPA: outer membrane beta-barrel protein [Candidatus Kapabacteria bacterium]|nr:outer membrane beta-barrel protein [Candidatus Kapabacteria bacterium]